MHFKNWLTTETYDSKIYIGDIWSTKNNLNSIEQILSIVKDFLEQGHIPLIKLNQTPDGIYETNNIYSVLALWNAGLHYLDRNNCIIIQTDYPTKKLWQIKSSPCNKQIQEILKNG